MGSKMKKETEMRGAFLHWTFCAFEALVLPINWQTSCRRHHMMLFRKIETIVEDIYGKSVPKSGRGVKKVECHGANRSNVTAMPRRHADQCAMKQYSVSFKIACNRVEYEQNIHEFS